MIKNRLYIILILVCHLSLHLTAQSDSVRLLPSTEIVAQRLNYFTIGQIYVPSDSFTQNTFQNQHLDQYLQNLTPLSIKAYSTGLATLTARGLAAQHSAIMWNGINLQNPLNGVTDLAILEVGSSQRIGVTLGGCSALCGSGAIGSVIYLDNQKAQREGLHGQLSFGMGSYDWRNRMAQLEYNTSKIAVNLHVSSQSATNDFTYRNTAEIGQPLRRATHSNYDFLNISSNFYAQLSRRDFLKTHFWQSKNYREITPTMTAASDNSIYRDTSNRLTSEWTHFFNKSFIKVRGAYLFDKNFYESNAVKNSQNGIYSYIGEAEWNYNFSEKHRLRFGSNITSDHSDNNNYKENIQRNRVALFINDAIKTDFITLSGNIRQEWVDEKVTPTTFAMGFEKPLASKKLVKSAWILRGTFSRNFNIPTFNDLYWPNLGNPQLVNELGWSKELGMSYKYKMGAKRLEILATLFDINIKNRIVWQPQSDGKFRPTNLNQVKSRGVETWANYAFAGTQFQYKINISYQYAHAIDGNGGIQLFVPQHKGGAGISAQYKSFTCTWQQSASSRRYGTTDQTTWTNPFTLADVTVGYTPPLFKITSKNIAVKSDIRLNITNVFNTDYQVIRYYPNPKRQYRLELSMYF